MQNIITYCATQIKVCYNVLYRSYQEHMSPEAISSSPNEAGIIVKKREGIPSRALKAVSKGFWIAMSPPYIKEPTLVSQLQEASRRKDFLRPEGEIFSPEQSAINTGQEKPLSKRQRLKKLFREKVVHKKNPITEKIIEALGVWGAPDIRVKNEANLEKAIKLAISEGKNLAFVVTHFSHFDSPAFERALKRIGFSEIVPNLVYLQGIKMDKNPIIKGYTTAFNTIKVWPPSLTVEEEMNNMKLDKNPIARILFNTLDKINPWRPSPEIRAAKAEEKRKKIIEKRMAMNRKSLESTKKVKQEGLILLAYAQGGRSKNGKLTDVSPTVLNYLNGTITLPVSISETDKVLPADSIFLIPAAPVTIDFREPIDVDALMREHQGKPHEKRKKVAEIFTRTMNKGLSKRHQRVFAED